MDIINLINLWYLGLFFISLALLIVNMKLISRYRQKAQALVLENEHHVEPGENATPVAEQEINTAHTELERRIRLHQFAIPVLILLMVIFGALSFLGILLPSKQKAQESVAVQEVQSSGIRVYSADWTEIGSDETDTITPGQIVYIGVSTIPSSDVDQARIKVNEQEWTDAHITPLFDPDRNIYYLEYIVSESDTVLDIEAQLHSAKDGWLSE